MAHLSSNQNFLHCRAPLSGFALRVPRSLLVTLALEILSIGSFLCVCLALIAEFS
jgi:hypothetical protein